MNTNDLGSLSATCDEVKELDCDTDFALMFCRAVFKKSRLVAIVYTMATGHSFFVWEAGNHRLGVCFRVLDSDDISNLLYDNHWPASPKLTAGEFAELLAQSQQVAVCFNPKTRVSQVVIEPDPDIRVTAAVLAFP